MVAIKAVDVFTDLAETVVKACLSLGLIVEIGAVVLIATAVAYLG